MGIWTFAAATVRTSVICVGNAPVYRKSNALKNGSFGISNWAAGFSRLAISILVFWFPSVSGEELYHFEVL